MAATSSPLKLPGAPSGGGGLLSGGLLSNLLGQDNGGLLSGGLLGGGLLRPQTQSSSPTGLSEQQEIGLLGQLLGGR